MSFEPVSHNFTAKMPELIVNHTTNAVLGLLFGMCNIPLLITLTSTSKFRTKYFTLIVLCLADSFNCGAIFLMGINRVNMYSDVISTLSVPVRTSWECAMEPWLWFRGIGDLWPPMVQIIVGIERFSAVFLPTYFKKLDGVKIRVFMTSLSVVYVIVVMFHGFSTALDNKDVVAKYYCGRKAAFGTEYGHYIYFSNISCYTFGVLICAISYRRCIQLKTQPRSIVQRVRYALVISSISTILVSIPNGISMLKAYMPIADVIAKPSVYASSLNSGINFFVYLALNPEFRQRFFHWTKLQRRHDSVSVVAFS